MYSIVRLGVQGTVSGISGPQLVDYKTMVSRGWGDASRAVPPLFLRLSCHMVESPSGHSLKYISSDLECCKNVLDENYEIKSYIPSQIPH